MVTVPTPVVELISEETISRGLTLMMKRDDLIHPTIMGNKWRKLKYNLETAKISGFKTLLTFGGAYSNHIAATASAAKLFGFQSIGIIRGEELDENSNPTLIEAAKNGMILKFVSREDFRKWKVDFEFVKNAFHDAYILPEGGTNELAVKGAAEVIDEITEAYDFLICPVGTGGTMAGLLKNLPSEKQLIGISSLKGSFVTKDFQTLITQCGITKTNWTISEAYHFGGYGKVTDELIHFANQFKIAFEIALDPIYTAKMMFGVYDMIRKDYFPQKARIMVLHTGGLQGIAGFNFKMGEMIL
ncbi:MAG: 1-aminocyclopropane-1-carboxylate deaminase [Cyclobacteriaceae bacterium]|jgi:1-aminocyclopropane-1-carboxylate deaminase